ncbi:MAG: hypothetical protein N2167_03640 [Flavobacteriales bacterium]|nr:hypothetical protein [Flavobacteriales bacterium]
MTFDDLHIPAFELPLHSRIWIYQASRAFTPEEEIVIRERGTGFINDWAAHGTKLMAELQVVLHRFIIVAVDEQKAQASGCSIDKMFRFIQQLQLDLKISLMDRLQVAYWHEPTQQVRSFPLAQLEHLLHSGEIQRLTLVFDNTIQQLGDITTCWVKPLEQTWLKNHIQSLTH